MAKKKSRGKKLTHTGVRKRLRLTAPGEYQEKENKESVSSAETSSTSSIPVKSFYNTRNTPSPVVCGNVSPIPSLIPIDETNEVESPTSRARLEPIWTRSRPYIFTNPTMTYPPYKIGFVSSFSCLLPIFAYIQFGSQPQEYR